MSTITKVKSVLTVTARGRKYKGNNFGIELTIPLQQARGLGIFPNDLVEIEIRSVRRSDVNLSLAHARARAHAHTQG